MLLLFIVSARFVVASCIVFFCSSEKKQSGSTLLVQRYILKTGSYDTSLDQVIGWAKWRLNTSQPFNSDANTCCLRGGFIYGWFRCALHPLQCLHSHHPSYRLLYTVHAIALQWMPTQMTVYAQTLMTVFAQHCINRKRGIIQGWWGGLIPQNWNSEKRCHTMDFSFIFEHYCYCAAVRIRKLQPLESTVAAQTKSSN